MITTTRAIAVRQPVPVLLNRPLTLELPASEVCLHMKLTGKRRQVRLVRRPGCQYMAEILGDDGTPCCGAVLPGEAGIYRNGIGDEFYAYPPVP